MTEEHKQPEKNPNALRIYVDDEKTPEEREATLALMPSVKAMATVRAYSGAVFGNVDATALCDNLKSSATKVNNNDLSEVEAHLINQAQTLDSVFHNLASRASHSQSLEGMKILLTLALKAQNQSRMTMETLALIKNPQPYVRQQNVAVNQQVNNAAPAPHNTLTRGGNSEITNKLEDKRHEQQRLDTGAPTILCGLDTDDKTLVEVNWAKDTCREG